ncbi:hypothetical protein Q8A67_013105 [Cirrhinus molitorella]|uniref:Uncharacterized protein n=1 Tax=Cirrhinus molitorella TaxID=172907 RepID=A0AA88TN13_9TELE|nr:hypothetical protein Q8A67_013105 [Cirrhinus molitorella]
MKKSFFFNLLNSGGCPDFSLIRPSPPSCFHAQAGLEPAPICSGELHEHMPDDRQLNISTLANLQDYKRL